MACYLCRLHRLPWRRTRRPTLVQTRCTPIRAIAVFDGVNADHVCVPGDASAVPDVTSAERVQVYAEYSIADFRRGSRKSTTSFPLELGGSNNITNLWVEPYQPTRGPMRKTG